MSEAGSSPTGLSLPCAAGTWSHLAQWCSLFCCGNPGRQDQAFSLPNCGHRQVLREGRLFGREITPDYLYQVREKT